MQEYFNFKRQTSLLLTSDRPEAFLNVPGIVTSPTWNSSNLYKVRYSPAYELSVIIEPDMLIEIGAENLFINGQLIPIDINANDTQVFTSILYPSHKVDNVFHIYTKANNRFLIQAHIKLIIIPESKVLLHELPPGADNPHNNIFIGQNESSNPTEYFLYDSTGSNLITSDLPISKPLESTVYPIKIINSPNEIKLKHIENYGNYISDINSSFMVLRTNPKLTGNIKLVVDTENKIHLDTFKVSSILSDRRYRKKTVSSSGNLASDIRDVFSSLPTGDLYKIKSDNLLAHKIYTDYSNQYDMTYSYGAENNDDELYSENFKILAPLWIKQNMPDFFAIFRVDNINGINSTEPSIKNLKGLLSSGHLVQLYDMRSSSPIGKYLRNHLSEIEHIPGPLYLQFKEQETGSEDSVPLQGENSWSGIAVDKGIIANRAETSYFSNKILSDPFGRQEYYNQYLMEGFERHNLISANLINLEFMFNDLDATLYKMYKYYGLYLTENEILNYSYISYFKDPYSGLSILKKYNENFQEVNDSVISDPQKGIFATDEYKDRLIMALTPNKGKRLQTPIDLKNLLDESVINKPYKNILTTPIKKVDSEIKKDSEFLVLNLNKPLEPGNHLRFIFPEHKKVNKDDEVVMSGNQTSRNEHTISRSIIVELIASDDAELEETSGFISPYPQISIQETLDLVKNVGTPESQNDNTPLSRYKKSKSSLYGLPLGINNPTKYLNRSETENFTFDKIEDIHDNNVIIYRVMFYTNKIGNTIDPLDENINHYSSESYDLASVEDQIARIKSAIDKISKSTDLKLYVSDVSSDSISIISNYRNSVFQRIFCPETESPFDYFGNKNINLKPSVYTSSLNNQYPDNETIYIKPDNKIHYLLSSSDILDFGDRLQTSISFAKTDNLYEIELSDIGKLKFVSLYKTIDGLYRPLRHFDFKSFSQTLIPGKSYLNKDDIPLLQSNIEYTTKSITEDLKFITLQSPLDLTKYVISAFSDIKIENHLFVAYSTYPVSVSLMGINNIKDFSYPGYDTYSIESPKKGLNEILISKGQRVYIGSNSNASQSEITLPQNRIFTLVSGSFYSTPIKTGSTFSTFSEIESEDLSFPDSEKNISSGYLTASTDVTIRLLENSLSSASNDSSSMVEYPKQREQFFFETPGESYSQSNLKYPLITPTSSFWEMVGTDYNNLNYILNTEYAVRPANLRVNPGVKSLDYISNRYNHNFIKNSIYDIIKTGDGNSMTFKDYILSSNVRGGINRFLNTSKRPIYSVGHYNKFTDTFEFILSGIKFNLSVNANRFKNSINLATYNNYLVYFVNVDMMNRESNTDYDFIIDTDDRTMLIIRYKSSEDIKTFYSNNIDPYDGNFKYNLNYLYSYSDFNLDFYNMFLQGSSANPITKVNYFNGNPYSDPRELNFTFAQFDFMKYHDNRALYLDMNENSLVTDSNGKINSKNNSLKFNKIPYSVSNFNNYAIPEDIKSKTLMTDFLYSSNHPTGYNYSISYNLVNKAQYQNSISSNTDNQDLISLSDIQQSFNDKDIQLYIKGNNKINTITLKPSDHDVMINLSRPKNSYYNYGYFTPHFNNVLEFYIDESESLSEKLKGDFNSCNTRVSDIKGINLYVNKIFNASTYDSDSMATYTQLKNFDLTKSSWADDFYRRYSSPTDYINISGSESGYESKSFFGSKGIVLKTNRQDSSIIITDWTGDDVYSISENKVHEYSTTQNNIEFKSYIAKFNVTSALSSYLLQNSQFIDNWRNIESNQPLINRYIQHTMQKFFKINSRNAFTIYAKPSSNENVNRDSIMSLSRPSDFETRYSKVDNIDSKIVFEKNNYFYIVKLTDLEKQYYCEFSIK